MCISGVVGCPRGQLSPPATHSHSSGMGERIIRVKGWKLMEVQRVSQVKQKLQVHSQARHCCPAQAGAQHPQESQVHARGQGLG